MEPISLSLLPIIVNKLLASNKAEKKEALASLKKMLLVECRINLKILDVTKNDHIGQEEKYNLLSSLKNEASNALFGYADYSIVKTYLPILELNKDDSLENDLLLVSIISKIELLKILSSDLKKLSEQKVIILKARINNLHEQLTAIVKKLNNDLA
ncbi:hypothetical protein [Polaribacter sp.]|uniref:hypothetical protein n=1 Tax=Polaribacter sp. TaxID=1920175 RepID=UPI003F6B981A